MVEQADVHADVIVVGMGPGGEHAANELAKAGLSVVGVEGNLVGGECPYWGCIPSKMMVRAAQLIGETRRAPALAGNASVTPDWSLVAQRIRNEATDNWDDRVAADRFTGNGGRLVRGRATIVDAHSVSVDGMLIRAARGLVLATGSAPFVPPIDGLSDVPYWTNHEALEADTLPASIVVLGGGTIGVELAQVFARFGVRVTVLEGGPRILSREEPESSEAVQRAFERDGIQIITGWRADRVEATDSAVRVYAGDRQVSAERLLVAVGRRVDIKTIGAGALGIDDSAPFLPVDDHLQVVPGVWAVGDITGKGMFTHVSMYQAGIVIDALLGREQRTARYHAVPRVTFTDPEVGSVGLTEHDARSSLANVRVGSTPAESSTRGWIHGEGGEGVIKVIVDADRNVVVGATVTAPYGGEILGFLALAVQQQTTIDDLRNMIYAYPTYYRAIESAVAAIH